MIIHLAIRLSGVQSVGKWQKKTEKYRSRREKKTVFDFMEEIVEIRFVLVNADWDREIKTISKTARRQRSFSDRFQKMPKAASFVSSVNLYIDFQFVFLPFFLRDLFINRI